MLSINVHKTTYFSSSGTSGTILLLHLEKKSPQNGKVRNEKLEK